MIPFFIDFETRSECDLKECGAAKYAMHPSTEVLCMGYSVGQQDMVHMLKRPVFDENKWEDTFCHSPLVPNELRPFIEDPQYAFTAHNAFFEECIWEYVLHRRYGWPSLHDPKRWRDTLAKAYMCGLPGRLYNCGAALQITAQKKVILGKATLNRLSVPSEIDANGKAIWNEDEKLFEDLYEYNKSDIEAMKEIDARLPELPETERKVWELDFTINHRGIHSDVPTARLAMDLAATVTDKLNKRLDTLTLGQCDKATQLLGMKYWLEGQGVKVESLDKASLRDIMARSDVPSLVKEVLYIRSQVGKSSTSKFKSIINMAASDDNRIRGTLQYHGAGTGRWTARGVQFQNLPQGNEKDPDAAIEAIKADDPDWFEMRYPQAMETLSSCVRGISLTAPEGKKIVVADYSGIEVCVEMWVAGQEDALALLRAGKTLYGPMGDYIYKQPDGTVSKHNEATKKEYKVAKATVLGAGYSMWWPKFLEQCIKQGIELGSNELTAETTDDYEEEGTETKKKTRKMTEAEVRAKDAILAYRKKYNKVPELWAAAEQAAKLAIKNPSHTYPIAGGKVVYGMDMKREFLCCMLPSGRCIRYYKPFLRTIKTKWGKEREEIHFWGEDSKTHQWSVQKTYGGSLVENFTQGIARDIMANGMLNCETASFPIVLTVHDELIAEMWDATTEGNKLLLDNFIKKMCNIPPWAAGMPISAEGWVGERYRK